MKAEKGDSSNYGKFLPLAILLLLFSLILVFVLNRFPVIFSGALRYEPLLNWEAISSLLGVVVSILTAFFALMSYFRDKERDREIKRDEIYQTLEFASEDLFQLEIEQRDLIYKFYEDDTRYADLGPADRFAAKEYFCKILNLFEMATNFRLKKIAHPEIYATWVAWIYETCESAFFRELWKQEGLQHHYDKELAVMIAHGCKLFETCRDMPEKQKLESFYRKAAFTLGEIRSEDGVSAAEAEKSAIMSFFKESNADGE